MNKNRFVPILLLFIALTAVQTLHADVKKEERNQVTFGGMLGRMFNFFGGKSAKEGTLSSVAISGDRKMTTRDDGGEIVDLKEEKIYTLDIKKKTYSVATFAEIRQKMAEMEAKAREDAAKAPKTEDRPAPQKPGTEMDVDLDVKDSGQTKTINGFDAHEVIVTVTVREKGKTLDESGGLVMTTHNWLTPSVPALKEVAAFDLRFYKALASPQMMVDAQQMATAVAMMPGLKEAFARMDRAELEGTAIASTTTVEAVKSAEQMKEQASGSADSGGSSTPPTSLGGAIGGLMRRRAQQNQQSTAASPRSTFMTINHEVLKIATNVTAADVALPAGFQLK